MREISTNLLNSSKHGINSSRYCNVHIFELKYNMKTDIRFLSSKRYTRT